MKFQAIYDEEPSRLNLLVQQELVKHFFPGCRVRIDGSVLIANFKIRDEDYKHEYSIEVKFYSQGYHKVFILHPKIKPSIAIHMYPDTSLCLYYPPDISPLRRLFISRDLIPLTALWICHYEQWLINGRKWKGAESPIHQLLMIRAGLDK